MPYAGEPSQFRCCTEFQRFQGTKYLERVEQPIQDGQMGDMLAAAFTLPAAEEAAAIDVPGVAAAVGGVPQMGWDLSHLGAEDLHISPSGRIEKFVSMRLGSKMILNRNGELVSIDNDTTLSEDQGNHLLEMLG